MIAIQLFFAFLCGVGAYISIDAFHRPLQAAGFGLGVIFWLVIAFTAGKAEEIEFVDRAASAAERDAAYKKALPLGPPYVIGYGPLGQPLVLEADGHFTQYPSKEDAKGIPVHPTVYMESHKGDPYRSYKDTKRGRL